MLMLTKAEYELLSEAFTKLATLAADGREMVKSTVPGSNFEASAELIIKTNEELSMLGVEYNKQGLTKIPAGRKPLRAFEQYLKHAVYSMTMQVLPQYDERVKKAPNDAAKVRLKVYIVKAKARVELINGILKKIDKELSK